jgi:hypothetical protein
MIERAVADASQEFFVNGEMLFPAEALIVTGSKPARSRRD